MRVQRLLMPEGGAESYTVLADDHGVVDPVEAYLAHLAALERSPNTVRAYAHDLRDFFAFLEARGLAWTAATVEDVGAFVAWLRLPAEARAGNVALLPGAEPACAAATVNRKLSALCGFYEFHARRGVEVSAVLTLWRPDRGERAHATSWKPFLQHTRGGGVERRRAVKLKTTKTTPATLTAEQTGMLLAACQRLRDRLLVTLWHRAGLRVGETLGLRHSDIDVAAQTLTVAPRHNANGARVKGGQARTVPVDAAVVRLYADYLHAEYGGLDSDYVFVNLWAPPVGAAMTYARVYDLVRRLRRRTGVAFGPHTFRHTYATDLLRRGAPLAVVSKLLGHASVATTADIYAITPRRRGHAAGAGRGGAAARWGAPRWLSAPRCAR